MSTPVTWNPALAKPRANGRPVYPSPTTPILRVRVHTRDSKSAKPDEPALVVEAMVVEAMVVVPVAVAVAVVSVVLVGTLVSPMKFLVPMRFASPSNRRCAICVLKFTSRASPGPRPLGSSCNGPTRPVVFRRPGLPGLISVGRAAGWVGCLRREEIESQ
jgi:hypothetical protein